MRTIQLILVALTFSAVASAAPDCLDHGKVLPENNQKVLDLKANSKEQWHDRAHIVGTVTQIYGDKFQPMDISTQKANDHTHFQATIGPNPGDTIEIVYSKDFGPLSTLKIGAQVEACGDYITARTQDGRYPPSPDGALVHWVHRSDNPSRHASGYVILDGKIYGN